MPKSIFTLLILTLAALLPSCRSAKAVDENTDANNLIIYYSRDAGNARLLDAAKRYGSKVIYIYRNINGIAVTVPTGKSASDAIGYYEKVDGVLSVVKDEKMQLD